jgi:hemerythrin
MNVEWKDSYKIGHAVIDQQHQHLFKLSNALMDAEDVGALRRTMVQLYKHTREHFDLEEALMRKSNYPDTEVHTEWHNNLLSRLNDASEEVGRGHVQKDALVQLMYEWSLHHIPKDDAKLSSFLAQR